MGLKRGSLVKHKKYGITYIGGTSKGKVSLHSIETGERLTRSANLLDIVFLNFNSWRIQQFLPVLKGQGSLAV